MFDVFQGVVMHQKEIQILFFQRTLNLVLLDKAVRNAEDGEKKSWTGTLEPKRKNNILPKILYFFSQDRNSLIFYVNYKKVKCLLKVI